jgi:hypothetical protein
MRFTVVILILTVLSCREKQQQLSLTVKDTLDQNFREEPVIEKKVRRPQAGLILSTDNIKILGDTTIERKKIYLTSIKFEPYISFEDFQVDEINTVKAELDFTLNKDAYRFRTIIREAYKADTVNFAGHYTFVWWGCGSPCQDGVIVDRRTGKIYDAPSASLGYDFKQNSRMLIVNPPDSTGFYHDNSVYGKPAIYVLDEKTSEFVELHPK